MVRVMERPKTVDIVALYPGAESERFAAETQITRYELRALKCDAIEWSEARVDHLIQFVNSLDQLITVRLRDGGFYIVGRYPNNGGER